MARDQFYDHLRLASRTLGPPGPPMGPGEIADAGSTSRPHSADLWLTPRSVEGFDPDEFTVVLIASIAGRRGVPDDTRDVVQEIREFRNYLIHEEPDVKKRFTIDDASRYLNTYLARLPSLW